MRFLKDGPSIPDELLIARDEGQVVFFCGAGISRARSGLPDFFELARRVLEKLKVAPDSPSRKLMDVAQGIEPITGVGGLISTDRVFGLLEREFRRSDIEEAVAWALRPKPDADLSAHRVLLDLARGADGRARIVTTNFDLLFEACDSSLTRWAPPRLPDPLRYADLAGVTHLHGYVNDDYSNSSGDGFVLSSAEFGRAYLSDAWATQFIRAIVDKYCVVFVGYAADDPPVQYLLEALNRTSRSRGGIYAFQAGPESDAQAIWRDRGVRPIAYDEDSNHQNLWNTLEAWATRAINPDKWYDAAIEMARRGPEALLPHQRGQVAHIVSTKEGARKFATTDALPPAEWLCVFDPAVRYLKPGHLRSATDLGPFVDPFEAYGLDSDPVPKKIDPDDSYAKREVPPDVWDAFVLTRLDRESLVDGDFAALRGHWAHHTPRLAPRISLLGAWIARTSHQPSAVWWVSGQYAIHPDIQSQIRFELERRKVESAPAVRTAWRYIFEAWETRRSELQAEGFELKAAIALDGWNSSAVREFAQIQRPFFKVERRYWGGPRPPEPTKIRSLKDLVYIDVEYPRPESNIVVPDEWLVEVIRQLRKNLELAVILESELGSSGLTDLPPIESDPGLAGDVSSRDRGLPGTLFFYVSLLKRLIETNVRSAKEEFLCWPAEEQSIFARLRIWLSADPSVLSGEEAGAVFRGLRSRVFWGMRHQRDLLIALSNRWSVLSPDARSRLEARLLRGPRRWPKEPKLEYRRRRAHAVLERIEWLKDKGCQFNPGVHNAYEKLKLSLPAWTPESAANAAASTEARGGWVRRDPSYGALLGIPAGNLLSKAVELSGHEFAQLVDRDPFSGLATDRPLLALAALRLSGTGDDFPTWAWQTYLFSEARKLDRPPLAALIGERIAQIPAEALAKIASPVASWLTFTAGTFTACFPKTFSRVWDRLLSALVAKSDAAETSVIRGNKEADWATEALNAPVGKLAQILMDTVRFGDFIAEKPLPASWLVRAESLLNLSGDAGRHALVIFAFNLRWFYFVDKNWAEAHLLRALDQSSEDQGAFWAGFFWAAKWPGKALFLRLKLALLAVASEDTAARRSHVNVLAGILLSGWGSFGAEDGHQYVTDDEFRGVLVHSGEEFRSNVLWDLASWSAENKEWDERKFKLLRNVWPRQKATKTPSVSARLCELAFADANSFPEAVDAILPLVTTVDGTHLTLPELKHSNSSSSEHVIERFPEKALQLLWAILSDNASTWPYGVGEAIDRIGMADSSLLNDSRFLELRRRWNAR